jgi:signal transduction histidine kinase
MKGDPTTERARSVVTLVILTVAVPSILLTALAAVAVENEEAAAKKRLETAYGPVLWEAAQKFNARMDRLFADGDAPLAELARFSLGEPVDVDRIAAFVRETGPIAINWFVIDPKGEVLVPRESDDEADCDATCEVAERARPEAVIEHARVLVQKANDPLRPSSMVSERSLAAMIGRLDKLGTEEAVCARDMLRSLAGRDEMLEQLRDLSHPRDTALRSQTLETNDWRRVIVARSIDDHFAGFELVPCMLEPVINQALVEKGLAEGARAYLHPVQMPKEWHKDVDWKAYDSRVLSWTLLKKTNLAWKLEILAKDQGGIMSVTGSRSVLYFWALILLAGALVAGIAYTIRTVSYEARVARLKTDFVSSVSHDLRTPLTSIRMFTETLLLDRAASKEEEREFLQVIADETDRLSRLTERILDFSRMEAGRKAYQFTSTAIPELVTQALRACSPMIEEARFDVTTTYGDALPAIEADHDAMVEVLINLISNAIKYSPDQRNIIIRAFVEGDRVGISVSDRGIGIAKAEHGKIFEKFYRVDSRRAGEVGGTGLGLSLVHHIVSAHGGDVTVDSTLDQGSTFTVWLPAPAGEIEPSLEVRTWRPSSS